MAESWSDRLARFKSEEKPESVLVMSDDAALTKIVVACDNFGDILLNY